MADVSQIEGNLWLGSYPPTQGLPDFSYIFNMDASAPYAIRAGQVVIATPLIDGPEIPNEHLLEDIAMLVEAASYRGPTLVHCAAGLNCSGLIMGLVLINRGFTAEEAITMMRTKRRPEVLCNPHFEAWLRGRAHGRIRSFG